VLIEIESPLIEMPLLIERDVAPEGSVTSENVLDTQFAIF